MRSNPCFRCQERAAGCSITCPRWQEHLKKRNEEYAERRKANIAESDSRDFLIKSIEKTRRRH